jgi:carbamoyltransferase
MAHSILGISDDYTSNVALWLDGRPVFAVADERLTRRKGQAGFPQRSVQAALDSAGMSLRDVDEVVVANRTHFVYRLLRAHFDDHTHDFFSPEQKVYLRFHDLVWHSGAIRRGLHGFNLGLLSTKLRRPVSLCDHHLAHACSALASSGFDRCLVVTMDNLGDGASAKIYSWRDGRMSFLQGAIASDSPGQFYGEITQLLGFNPLRHAGKITGLAAMGDPAPAAPIMRQLFHLSPDGRSFRLLPSWRRWQARGPYAQLGRFTPEDVAAAAQWQLERVVSRWVQGALERTGLQQMALAGGVAANVKLNLALRRIPGVRAVHVHPAMSDEGLAMGAAASRLVARGELAPAPLETAYLGPGWSEEAVRQALTQAGLGFVEPALAPAVAARLLAGGHTVARYAGRQEYGPRALGNRSILHRPDDPRVKDWLNARLHRTEFMPFAPVVRHEDAPRCFEGLEGCEDPARFMAIALDCTPWYRRRCPGVVHVDGTARPQILRHADNPFLHDILTSFQELTGLPSLLNTSLNMHEEPVVCSPSDAVAAFMAAGLDFLSAGPFMAWDPTRPALQEILRDARARRQ